MTYMKLYVLSICVSRVYCTCGVERRAQEASAVMYGADTDMTTATSQKPHITFGLTQKANEAVILEDLGECVQLQTFTFARGTRTYITTNNKSRVLSWPP